MSETPLTDSPALDLARQLQKHYSDKGQFFIAADFSNLRNQIELDARSLELQVTSLTAKLEEKERDLSGKTAYAKGCRESLRNTQQEASRMQAQLAAARKDSERVEKVEAMPVTSAVGKAPSGNWQVFGPAAKQFVDPTVHKTFREAIDALPPAPTTE